jgi:hypothetical protein
MLGGTGGLSASVLVARLTYTLAEPSAWEKCASLTNSLVDWFIRRSLNDSRPS